MRQGVPMLRRWRRGGSGQACASPSSICVTLEPAQKRTPPLSRRGSRYATFVVLLFIPAPVQPPQAVAAVQVAAVEPDTSQSPRPPIRPGTSALPAAAAAALAEAAPAEPMRHRTYRAG